MTTNRRFQVSLILVLIITLLITSCRTSEVVIEPTETKVDQPDDTGSLVTEEPTPAVTATETPLPPTHMASGLVFSNSDGTWWINRNGEIHLLIDKDLARSSPDGKWMAYVEEDLTTYKGDIWLMEVSTQRALVRTSPTRRIATSFPRHGFPVVRISSSLDPIRRPAWGIPLIRPLLI